MAGVRFDASLNGELDATPTLTFQLNNPIRGWQEVQVTFSHDVTAEGRFETVARAMVNGRAVTVTASGHYASATDTNSFH